MERLDGSIRRALRVAGVPDAGALAAVTRAWPAAVGPGIAVAAQVPIRISSKAAPSPLTITATLVGRDGTRSTLDRTAGSGRDYAGTAGKVYRVALPPGLTAGNYRVMVESVLGRTTVTREVAFSVLPRP